MPDVLQSRPADSPGYVRLLLSDAVGDVQAGAEVVATVPDGEQVILLHGQREFDVIDTTTLVTFPDGSTWKPRKG